VQIACLCNSSNESFIRCATVCTGCLSSSVKNRNRSTASRSTSSLTFRRRRRNLQFELLVVPQRFGVRPGVFQQLEHPHLPLPQLLVGLRMHEIVQSRRRLPPGVGFAVRLHHLDEQRDAPGLSHGETTLGVGAQRQEGFPHVGVLLAAQHRQQTVHHVHLGLELLGGAARQAGTPQKGPAGARRETHHAGQFLRDKRVRWGATCGRWGPVPHGLCVRGRKIDSRWVRSSTLSARRAKCRGRASKCRGLDG
jgi:hypothetical protein